MYKISRNKAARIKVTCLTNTDVETRRITCSLYTDLHDLFINKEILTMIAHYS